jgi:hypothetical protein
VLLLLYLLTLRGDAVAEGWVVLWMAFVSLVGAFTAVGGGVLALTWTRLDAKKRREALLWLVLCL